MHHGGARVTPRPYYIRVPPYSYDVHVLVATPEVAQRWFRRHGDKGGVGDTDGATYIPPGESDLYVWFQPNASMGAIAHEFVHVAVAVLHGSGVPVTQANDEAIAYIVEHLVDAYFARRRRTRGTQRAR